MENYEQKYKKALKRARDLHDNHPYGQPQTWMTCEKIFPELKESEDERIKKELISFITDRKNWFPKEETKSSWISWLENQGRDGKKWIYEDVYLKEKEQLIQDGIDEVLENPQKYGLEKQGEHKPAWSEEDKAILLSVKCVIDNVWHNSGLSDYDEKELQEMWEWLDEIWRRVVYPQPKYQWTDEDEKNLKDLLAYGETKLGLRRWIAGLPEKLGSRSEYHWKPSEEQMEIIDMILTNESMDDNVARILRELKEQLEKL